MSVLVPPTKRVLMFGSEESTGTPETLAEVYSKKSTATHFTRRVKGKNLPSSCLNFTEFQLSVQCSLQLLASAAKRVRLRTAVKKGGSG
jgi:hypothetical protein